MAESSIKLEDLPLRYGFIDPASSRKAQELRQTRARSAIVVIAPDWLGRIFVLDAWADRCSTDFLIDKLYRTHETWKLKVFGGEANGMQELFQESIMRDARLRGKELPLQPVHVPTRIEKTWRIRTILQPIIANGRLFLRSDMRELRMELTSFPLSPIVDMVDALASAVKLVPKRPTKREDDRELQELLSYLRKTGASPQVIAEVARKGGLG